jgi:hypothetical protein
MRHDISKQPQWVQDEVTGLERQVASLKAELADVLGAYVVDYPDALTWDRPLGIASSKASYPRTIETLPQGTSVYFKQRSHGGYIEVRQQRHDQNEIRIQTGGGRLEICPEVSNVIIVKIKERD